MKNLLLLVLFGQILNNPQIYIVIKLEKQKLHLLKIQVLQPLINSRLNKITKKEALTI